MLKPLNLLPVYDSAEHDLIQDLIVPLLKNSQEYLRGVGFFTSGWLKIASQGIVSLLENGGKAKFVVSPILDKQDWEALQLGEEAKHEEWLKHVLEKNIQDLADALEKDTRNALAWMVADDVLEFKFAIPREWSSGGDYHDKVGVFTDSEGDRVAIHGSFNDTIKGSLNGEAFSVFKSWEPVQSAYARIHMERLSKLFNEGNQQFKVYTIPEAAKRAFIQLRSSSSRPYSLSSQKESIIFNPHKEPHCAIKLYPYQEQAVNAWIQANCQGIFEMATGTGKTFTSLAAAVNRVKALGHLTLIILVPYLHLLEQWREECEKFGFFPILCSGEHQGWNLEVLSKIQDFNIGALKTLCILAVHDTATSEKFRKATKQLSSEYTLLIGDEVHALGSPSMQQALLPNITMRLGLSATPKRWFDEAGTEALFSYFGQVCFEFPLEKAIGTYLTPYTYSPILIHLSPSELEEYENLSQKISVFMAQSGDSKREFQETLEKLLIKRARILASAEQKLPKLLETLKHNMAERTQQDKEIRDILIYCAPGSHKEVLKAVAQLGLRCHEFVHTVALSEREKILDQFAKGVIQALVAIKCLDEGVDVPSTKTAYFLASTTNPREFVQRRGRILRLSEGKDKAEVYDFIIVPEPHSQNFNIDTGKSLLKREMPRFAEFASCALNEFEARSVVRDLLDQSGMLHLLDEKPWDIYYEIKKEDKFIGDTHA
jgi:superfamily II DNA or RNA helicase